MNNQTALNIEAALRDLRTQILTAFNNSESLSIKNKGRVDLVTEVDVAVEAILREKLLAIYPDAFFMGEESAADMIPGDNTPLASRLKELAKDGLCWIVDPIDGTTNLASGIPHVGVSVALYNNGEPLAGFVYDPARDEMFSALKGSGAWLNNSPITCNTQTDLMDCVVATGFPYDRAERWPFYRNLFERFLLNSRDLRRFGAASLDICWVACGRFDGYIEYNLKPWDSAAAAIIAEEAGVRMANFSNQEMGQFDAFIPEVFCFIPGVANQAWELTKEGCAVRQR
ncbi:MAG: inositol monophosphatase family protein [bacterium]|nr:inositol monophosphatase family protein [bacterium]